MRVLLVEDDLVLARALVRVLGVYADVDHAPDVAHATSRLDDQRYDVVVSDFDLPDGTGADVLETVRRSAPMARRILLTAASHVDAPPMLWERWFHKPEDVGSLVNWIGSIADRPGRAARVAKE